MKKAMLIVLPFCLALLACPMGCRPIAQDGGAPPPAKTIVPSADVAVSTYDVSGAGPDSATFRVENVPGPSVVRYSLASGDWTITVDAFNAEEERVGSGSIVVTIESGTVASREVPVKPLSGTGSLSINVSWPPGAIADPTIVGTLAPAAGVTNDLSFTMGTDSASCELSGLSAGYYSLLLRLSDDAVVEWGSFEAVRVLEGLTTTASFALEAEDLLSGS